MCDYSYNYEDYYADDLMDHYGDEDDDLEDEDFDEEVFEKEDFEDDDS